MLLKLATSARAAPALLAAGRAADGARGSGGVGRADGVAGGWRWRREQRRVIDVDVGRGARGPAAAARAVHRLLKASATTPRTTSAAPAGRNYHEACRDRWFALEGTGFGVRGALAGRAGGA